MSADAAQPGGGATGGVRTSLRFESLAVLLGSLFAFRTVHGRWLLFVVLFFAPDLSFAAYAISRSFGAIAYNTVHSYILPVSLLLWGYYHPAVAPYALIWMAHIGFDRALGYGLKYKTAFEHTHLGTMSQAKTL